MTAARLSFDGSTSPAGLRKITLVIARVFATALLAALSLSLRAQTPTPEPTSSPLQIPKVDEAKYGVYPIAYRDLIMRCLEKTGGNKRQAARLLQLSRTTLIDKLQRLNVTGDFAAA